MEEFEVDLVLGGHVHAYARTCNVYKERCIDNDDGGTTHITLGETFQPHVSCLLLSAYADKMTIWTLTWYLEKEIPRWDVEEDDVISMKLSAPMNTRALKLIPIP